MPVITKQVANSKPQKKAVKGSVLSEAIPVEELQDDFIKMLIYGQNRVGKTFLSCQFPKPLLLVACEPNKTGGALTVKKMPGVQFIRVDSADKALRLTQEIKEDCQFATVVVDSATSLQDIILKEILGDVLPEQLNWGTVSRDQYRERSEKTREALRPFINLPCHVIITAKERDHNVNEVNKPKILKGLELESFFAADLGGATVGWLNDACDYLGQLYIEKEIKTRIVKVAGKEVQQEYETGRKVRRLRTMYHPNYAAGFRSCTPEKVPEFIEEPSFSKILAVIEGKDLPSK